MYQCMKWPFLLKKRFIFSPEPCDSNMSSGWLIEFWIGCKHPWKRRSRCLYLILRCKFHYLWYCLWHLAEVWKTLDFIWYAHFHCFFHCCRCPRMIESNLSILDSITLIKYQNIHIPWFYILLSGNPSWIFEVLMD